MDRPDDFIPYAQRYKEVKVEGKRVDATYELEIDGKPVTIHEILVSLRTYAAQRDRAAERARRNRQKKRELKLQEKNE